MAVIDCFSYNGENEVLEARLNILNQHVDKFIIVEGTETFSGNPKSLYGPEFLKNLDFPDKGKIVYTPVIYGLDEELMSMLNKRTYVDQPAFRRSFYQKESIRFGLKDCSDDDIIYYGDVDEIWKPSHGNLDDKPYKLRQLAYSYYFNMRSSEDWRGTIVTRYKNVREGSLNDLRANPKYIKENGGWHFTNLGGLAEIRRKLESYDHQEANVPYVHENLEQWFNEGKDFLGRGFKMWIDDSELPHYILSRKEYYINNGLWKS